MEIKVIPKKSKRSPIFINTSHDYTENMDSENQDSKKLEFVRRTITIAPNINQSVQNFRIELMRQNPQFEYDYTSVANAIMAYGIVFLQNYERDPEDEKQYEKLMGDRFLLAEYGVGDVADDIRKTKLEALAESESKDSTKRKKGSDDQSE